MGDFLSFSYIPKKINQLTVNNAQSSGQMSVSWFMMNNSIQNEKDLDKLVLLSSIIWFFLYFSY